ncbi:MULTISPECIES: hypothetical protein [unclassified Flammeovirga]|uniref:hypothetical protein n=1 Tax=unclassified Flammeovirga TaxID=2637820 RepID=UPI000694C06C|nr:MULTISPECIES: hypothetical protein [unclassified Flammeovirga]MBD0404106.1 hypothetical protein [Flammeovirga sp. EKP202]
MKTLLISLIGLLCSVNLLAEVPEYPESNENSELVKMVQKAEANDWATYTRAAQLSINWNADLELAKEWIDHAVTVDENHNTLEVLGDYYLRVGDVKNAYASYEKALLKDITSIDYNSRARLQRKILVFSKSLK